MAEIAIIGGTGLTSLHNLQIVRREVVHTPYGEPSGPLVYGSISNKQVVFLPRHGPGHTIPPHKINYRANIYALQEVGVKQVIAVAAVGGIRADLTPGRLMIPDQMIDYTWGRSTTFFEDSLKQVVHIDFTEPYCNDLRLVLLKAGKQLGLNIAAQGVYAATQGPRLETTAEINRLERDGCDIVGMTGMPEAALARELGLCYASCSVVANMAAGRGDEALTMEQIERNLSVGMEDVRRLLEATIPLL
ncbi:MAG: S-methyl-5'-thioinosine phosphorylase [Gammaproteobacteria bacterium]|nr:S-methyl-5'-thioinosine phosphorylase [Gammaproteobacteria bacterium]